jgi:hypothetical protein
MIHRDKKQLAFIRTLPCIVVFGCQGETVPHHEDVLKQGGTGIKGPDFCALPLCDHHHKERHQTGKDTFYRKHSLDPLLEIIRHNALYHAYKGEK